MQKRRTGTNIHDENEANLSMVLVCIIVVFILCQFPGLIAQFDIFEFNVFLKWIAVSNILFVINSAVNFLIYTAFGSKFRKVSNPLIIYFTVKHITQNTGRNKSILSIIFFFLLQFFFSLSVSLVVS